MVEIDTKWLKHQYGVLGISQKNIATQLGCSQAWVHHLCKLHRIPRCKRADKNRIDLTNKKIGNLTVLQYQYTLKKIPYWLCKCDCDNIKVINGKHLKNGKILSCGCRRNKPSSKRKGYEGIPISYFNDLKRKAKIRKLEFSISIEEIWNQYINQNKKCALSGVHIDFPINQNKKYRSCKTASLDRINSSIGYVIGNIQWVHKHINLMKQDLSNEEFCNWCKIIAQHINNKASI
jgi:hypothetical protein